jgi:hypothetical protein
LQNGYRQITFQKPVLKNARFAAPVELDRDEIAGKASALPARRKRAADTTA